MKANMLVWIQFIVCTLVILFAGVQLSKYGDILAEKSGLGRTWIGVVLMASVTSLPELMTGVSSVTYYDLPNIAAGDVLGSCMFNILIIALLDFKRGAAPISSQVHQGQVLTAGYGILMLGLVSIGIASAARIPVIGWIGFYSVLFLLIYLGAIRMVFLYEKRLHTESIRATTEENHYDGISTRKAVAMYLVNALLVIAAAVRLPHLGEEIAEMTGLGRTFVGSVFIAVSTSLPELVVSFAALKLGAIDLAMGNLLGSNIFNIGILALDDFFYTKGPLLSHIAGAHAITANAAIVMTAIAVIGMTYRAGKKRFRFAWDSVGIMAVYATAMLILYLFR